MTRIVEILSRKENQAGLHRNSDGPKGTCLFYILEKEEKLPSWGADVDDAVLALRSKRRPKNQRVVLWRPNKGPLRKAIVYSLATNVPFDPDVESTNQIVRVTL